MLRNEFGVKPTPRDLTSVSNTRSCYTFVKPYLNTCTHVEEITRKQSEITKEKKRRLEDICLVNVILRDCFVYIPDQLCP